jgi:hypothetical protein
VPSRDEETIKATADISGGIETTKKLKLIG